jgi:hypothetical protein
MRVAPRCVSKPNPLGDGLTDNFDDAMFYMNDHSVRKRKPGTPDLTDQSPFTEQSPTLPVL